MKTLFAACLSRLGLSQAQAANYLGVSLPSIKGWSSGRNPVPKGIWNELRQYEAKIIDRSETIREIWEDAGEPETIAAQYENEIALMAMTDFILGGAYDLNQIYPDETR